MQLSNMELNVPVDTTIVPQEVPCWVHVVTRLENHTVLPRERVHGIHQTGQTVVFVTITPQPKRAFLRICLFGHGALSRGTMEEGTRNTIRCEACSMFPALALLLSCSNALSLSRRVHAVQPHILLRQVGADR